MPHTLCYLGNHRSFCYLPIVCSQNLSTYGVLYILIVLFREDEHCMNFSQIIQEHIGSVAVICGSLQEIIISSTQILGSFLIFDAL